MKKFLFAISISLLTSCSFGLRKIGDLNLVSNRNIDFNQDYELIRSYAGSDSKKEVKKEIKKMRSETLEDAINYTLKNTPGGEILTNVNIYMVRHKYYVVHGDVYGIKDAERNYKGWKVGDNVQWRSGGLRKGVIVELKDAEEASIKEVESGIVFPVRYERLTKDF